MIAILIAQLIVANFPPLSPAEAVRILRASHSMADHTDVVAPPVANGPRVVVGPDAATPAINEWWTPNYPNTLDRGWTNPVVVPFPVLFPTPILTSIPSGRVPGRREGK